MCKKSSNFALDFERVQDTDKNEEVFSFIYRYYSVYGTVGGGSDGCPLGGTRAG